MKPKLIIEPATQSLILAQIRKQMPKPAFAFRSKKMYKRVKVRMGTDV